MPGYQHSLFVVKPAVQLECASCHLILKDPQQICRNGHTFCKSCIETVWLTTKKCPTCHSSLSPQFLIDNLVIKQLIDSFQVKCSSDIDECCGWIGSVDCRSDHLENECPLALVSCNHGGCQVVNIRRKDLQGHQTVCLFKPVRCSDCAQLLTCSERMVACPSCKAQIRFPQLREHKVVCPHALMLCPLKQLNCCRVPDCNGSILRKDVQTHVNSPESLNDAVLSLIYHSLYLETVNQVLSLPITENKKNIGDSSEAGQLLLLLLKDLKNEENWNGIKKIGEQMSRRHNESGENCVARHVVFPTTDFSKLPAVWTSLEFAAGQDESSKNMKTVMRMKNSAGKVSFEFQPNISCTVCICTPHDGGAFDPKVISCQGVYTEDLTDKCRVGPVSILISMLIPYKDLPNADIPPNLDADDDEEDERDKIEHKRRRNH